jgi:hypothetical protein
MKKADVSITAIVFIVCGIIAVIFAGALIFKVPGLFGQLLGYIQTGLIATGASIVDFLMSIFGKYFSALASALGVTLNVVVPVLILQGIWPTLSSALSTGWKILTNIESIVAEKYGWVKIVGGAKTLWKLRFSELWKAFKSGVSGLSREAILAGIKNLIKTTAVMFFVTLGAELMLNYFGVPQGIDNWAHGVCPNCPNIGWSWGSAISSTLSTGLGLVAVVGLGLGPIGWIGAGIILAGSFIVGGFIH